MWQFHLLVIRSLHENNILPEEAKADIANKLKSVIGWEIGVSLVEETCWNC